MTKSTTDPYAATSITPTRGITMRLSPRMRFASLWLLIGAIAAVVCCLHWSTAHLGTESLPVGNDSFYHARRMIDTALNPGGFYEFDPRIHAPEGSLLTWPWGYDYAMGWLGRLAIIAGITAQPIDFLIWIPVITV